MKKFFCYIMLICGFLMLVACGKPDSQKAFENFFEEIQADFIKREEKNIEPFKTILKIYEKTTYKINKIIEKGDNAQLNITIKAVNFSKYMSEFSRIITPLIEKGIDAEEINNLAVEYYGNLVRNDKNLEYKEINVNVQLQKINGNWKILNTDDIFAAILGSSINFVEIVS